MTAGSLFRRAALAALALVLASCADQASPIDEGSTLGPGDPSIAMAAGGGTTLSFNGGDANASTPLGSVLSTQVDQLQISLDLRYDGPNAAHAHQTVYYTGHGAFTGWGIIILSQADGAADGTLCLLSGGINIPCSPWVLTPGTWHHISARRVDQAVTVTMDDLTWDAGILPVNPVGTNHAFQERTTIGGDGTFDAPSGDFNGAIDRVSVRDLAGDHWIERWNFNAGQGTTAVGANGTVLQIGHAQWARRGGN